MNTNKIDLIKAEVARIQAYTQSDVLKEVLDYIDKVKEEPVSVWHDASEKSNEPEDVVIINPSDNTGEVLTRCTDVYQGRIWAYTSVLLKFDNPCKIGKNLQEEPDYCCGECVKWEDGKGCSREKQNTHCITDAACEEGVRRGSKQKKPKFKVGDTIKAIDSCLGSPRTICEVCDSWYVTNQGTLDFEFEDNWELAEEPVSEYFENALAEEWKDYNDRGAAKVDALEDNTQELAFAKGFYRGWHYMDDEGLRKAVEGVSEDLGKYINELSKQFQEVSFAKLSRIAVRVAKWQKEKDAILPKVWNRENLDDFSYQTAYDLSNDWAKETPTWHDVEMACKLGANWQKANLWKSAEGTDLPIFDREVIALIDNGKVVFAHRPDPKGWDAKSIITEKVEHYTPETYGKGGWNQPNVKWWLDVDKLPNMEG